MLAVELSRSPCPDQAALHGVEDIDRIGAIRLRGSATAPVEDRDVRSGILYGATDVGRPRAEVIAERLLALNSDVAVDVSDDATLLELPEASDDSVCTALVTGGAAASALIAAIARGQRVRARVRAQ